jgi:regulatory protein
MSLHTRALQYLARREYSRWELERKLSGHVYSPEELTAVLDVLEQQGILSDERVAEQILHTYRRKYGSKRRQYELQRRRIAEHLITAVLEDLKETELSSARELWCKKFGASPSSPEERGKQIRYLTGKGFSSEIINKTLSNACEIEG